MSQLRCDRSGAAQAAPARCAARNQAGPRSRAQARSGDCCSRDAVPLRPAKGSAGPWTWHVENIRRARFYKSWHVGKSVARKFRIGASGFRVGQIGAFSDSR
jgi:hypothetical protein